MKKSHIMDKRGIVDELHKAARRNFKRRHVIVKYIDDLWQADLVEMGAYSSENNKFRYLITIIDTFSKYAWGVPVKNKTAEEVTKAFSKILEGARKPKNLQTDDGKEFFNQKFKSLMDKHHINHYSTYSVLKASIVERFNRTLKSMMWKEFSANGSYNWIDIIKTLIKSYNNKVHRTIKMRPSDVTRKNSQELLKTAYNHLKVLAPSKFSVGDLVRISKYKHVFEKGYTPNWTTEIFKVTTVQNTNPVTYLLEDYEGNPIKGGFYEYELMKTKHPDTFLIEKIIRRKGGKQLVKWLGFNSKHNSWIPIK